jgi:hypothetical protein
VHRHGTTDATVTACDEGNLMGAWVGGCEGCWGGGGS